MFKFEANITRMIADAKINKVSLPEIFPNERLRLSELAKKVAVNYSWILVCFLDKKNPYRDTKFFEEVFP